MLPDNPKLQAAAKQFIHSGKIICKDGERAAAIAQAFLECGQILPVAKRFHVSPNTVQAVVEVLEQAGKLDDLKQRVSRKLGLVAELGAERLLDKLEAGAVPANVLPSVVGVAIDKKALLDGDPTSRVATEVSVKIEAGDVLAYLTKRGLPRPAIDVESTVTTPERKETQ